MNTVAIVAIVAMFMVFVLGTSAGQNPETTRLQAPAEVILYIDPPLVIDPYMSLPDRNPVR